MRWRVVLALWAPAALTLFSGCSTDCRTKHDHYCRWMVAVWDAEVYCYRYPCDAEWGICRPIPTECDLVSMPG